MHDDRGDKEVSFKASGRFFIWNICFALQQRSIIAEQLHFITTDQKQCCCYRC